MYARRFADGPRFHPANLGMALAINGVFVAALILAGPDIVPRRDPPPLVIDAIPLTKPEPLPSPPPPDDRPAVRAQQQPDLSQPLPLPLPAQPAWTDPVPTTLDPLPGPAATAQPVPEPTVLPFVQAAMDPRYAGEFQPPYPDTARDAGREGVVTLRVRIGPDGRVKDVQRISGDDVFWRAASRHALARWRFTPATRGSVPVETWRTMTVRFRLD